MGDVSLRVPANLPEYHAQESGRLHRPRLGGAVHCLLLGASDGGCRLVAVLRIVELDARNPTFRRIVRDRQFPTRSGLRGPTGSTKAAARRFMSRHATCRNIMRTGRSCQPIRNTETPFTFSTELADCLRRHDLSWLPNREEHDGLTIKTVQTNGDAERCVFARRLRRRRNGAPTCAAPTATALGQRSGDQGGLIWTLFRRDVVRWRGADADRSPRCRA